MTPLTVAPPGTAPWPPEAADAYRSAGLWQGRLLGDLPWQWADRDPDRTALVDEHGPISYAELALRTDALADGLAAHGLLRGDTVLVQLPNRWELVVAVLACARIGVAPVLALPAHREHELSELARTARAAAVIVPGVWREYDHEALAHRLVDRSPWLRRVFVAGAPRHPDSVPLSDLARPGPAPAERRRRLDGSAPDPADVALFLLSGGTTGTPKLIGRTHDDYLCNARLSAEACGFGPDTVYLAVLPVGHNFPLACPGVLGTLHAGGRVVLARSAEPRAAFRWIREQGVTVTAAVPAVAQRWMAAIERGEADRADLATLRTVQVGGAPLGPELARRIGPGLDCRLQQVFGMAEGLLCYTRDDDPDELVVTTQGRPLSAWDEVRVVGADGAAVPDGRAGELWVRGPYTIRGYHRAPEHNRRAFTPEGWYRTGDVVSRLPSGHLVVQGRIKDLINRGGEKVNAKEVENLVDSLPQVHQAAVIGVPDPELGERVCLCVSLNPGAALTLGEIRTLFRDRRVARYKTPERLELFPALPLTPVGKTDKKALREQVAVRDGQPASSGT
ncbi:MULTISPECIES: (2,3-dihydroxybenzoyl)adenylate synthase [Streptomyces]|uniref:2,3-dihydroxybenzoate-AMP ligase n=1 Tax=Streptomyces spororaveus TaxID=284039 RepID=A0ABQ3T9S1_9ACTN|nr:MULTISPECIES: AMP-binding protein [Streptomyces]MCM9082455.1 AMP-binding protein [Streptomyces spororaveus]MCX5302970.1 AMP-binding protein [Streptomyces sp. NBC_00160]GHI77129.1 2,3-dihydroxybenzoate-AMP ligase [Streptomyces spororaveus]